MSDENCKYIQYWKIIKNGRLKWEINCKVYISLYIKKFFW